MYLIAIIFGIGIGFSSAYVIIAHIVERTCNKRGARTEFEKFSDKPIQIIKKYRIHNY